MKSVKVSTIRENVKNVDISYNTGIVFFTKEEPSKVEEHLAKIEVFSAINRWQYEGDAR